MGARLREANAEIQSGSYFFCFDRPDAIDRVVFQRVVVVFIVTLLTAQEENPPTETASVRKVVQDQIGIGCLSPYAMMGHCGFITAHGRGLRIYRRLLIGRAV